MSIALLIAHIILPILKKPGADSSVLSNFRPISLLPYLGKVLEAHVTTCLSSFIESSQTLDSHQAGFRPAHSTESVILAVLDELRKSADMDSPQALVLLDLSAAFDTVDHNILIDRVSDAGIQGPALQWLSSFLSNRSQAVRLGNFSSKAKALTCGVHQGSSLSPLLFNLYLCPLIRSLKEKKIKDFNYADDLQLVFDINSTAASICTFQSTMIFIHDWMNQNQLKMNPDKTELILTGGQSNPWHSSFWPPSLGCAPVPACSAKSLGIVISSDLSLSGQNGSAVSASFFQLRKIKKD